MKFRHKEQGSITHIIIIVLLIVAVVGTLGWVFWQNFAQKTAQTNSTSTSDAYEGWKSYTFQDTGTKFRYPAEWQVGYFAPSEEDGRTTPSLLLSERDEALANNVVASLPPTIEVYDPAHPEPTLANLDPARVIYSEELSNSMYLVCVYREGPVVVDGPSIQSLDIHMAGEGNSLVVVSDGNSLIINGGNVEYRDGSLSEAVAKELCASPKPGEYTTDVIRWLKSIEL
jgi:hypothetical protein